MVNPVLLVCPYLRLSETIQASGWKIGPVDEFEDDWGSPELRKTGLGLLEHFLDADGKPIERPVLLCREDAGITGERPSNREFIALQTALHFCVLDGNPKWSPGAQGWNLSTADNSILMVWQLDLSEGFVTLETGVIARRLNMGYRISDEELLINAPLELHLPMVGPRIQARTFRACYDCLTSKRAGEEASMASGIETAISWLAKAWKNSTSIAWEDRLVMLKTAFDALAGVKPVRPALRALFDGLSESGVTDVGAKDLLWSPSDLPKHNRIDRHGKAHTFTDLEDWFFEFNNARNTIIHEGVVPDLEYQVDGSAFSGPFFWIGERLLREAIKLTLGLLGYPNLWRSDIWWALQDTKDEMGLS